MGMYDGILRYQGSLLVFQQAQMTHMVAERSPLGPLRKGLGLGKEGLNWKAGASLGLREVEGWALCEGKDLRRA
jgi:hypothetical protein